MNSVHRGPVGTEDERNSDNRRTVGTEDQRNSGFEQQWVQWTSGCRGGEGEGGQRRRGTVWTEEQLV